mmetsp:Transcript_3391/g.10200  ORF Transcript_3391/g.10200 Transcript_3391/m.10200 type:complete len:207 (-) Transcript_3391:443-1063(-)
MRQIDVGRVGHCRAYFADHVHHLHLGPLLRLHQVLQRAAREVLVHQVYILGVFEKLQEVQHVRVVKPLQRPGEAPHLGGLHVAGHLAFEVLEAITLQGRLPVQRNLQAEDVAHQWVRAAHLLRSDQRIAGLAEVGEPEPLQGAVVVSSFVPLAGLLPVLACPLVPRGVLGREADAPARRVRHAGLQKPRILNSSVHDFLGGLVKDR